MVTSFTKGGTQKLPKMIVETNWHDHSLVESSWEALSDGTCTISFSFLGKFEIFLNKPQSLRSCPVFYQCRKYDIGMWKKWEIHVLCMLLSVMWNLLWWYPYPDHQHAGACPSFDSIEQVGVSLLLIGMKVDLRFNTLELVPVSIALSQ
jgi:hypothetical protein